MKSVNFVVIGEQSIASDFGKKGTETDLTLFDKKESDIIRTSRKPISKYTQKLVHPKNHRFVSYAKTLCSYP